MALAAADKQLIDIQSYHSGDLFLLIPEESVRRIGHVLESTRLKVNCVQGIPAAPNSPSKYAITRPYQHCML